MNATAPAPLDPKTCELAGIVNIEASAGTGKTYSLCELYLRLILEKNLAVGNILVVTFTEAAAAELRGRIYRRLADSLATAPADGEERRRLQAACRNFDEAAIFTIHGFCHRALGRLAFAAGQPLAAAEVGSGDEFFRQAAEDFWRRHVLPLTGLEARALIADKAINIDAFAAALRDIVGRPLALRRPQAAADPVDFAGYAALLDAMRPVWAAGATEARIALAEACERGDMNRTRFSTARVGDSAAVLQFAAQNDLAGLDAAQFSARLREQGIVAGRCWEAWESLLAGSPPTETLLEEAGRLTAGQLIPNKGREAPQHALFAELESWLEKIRPCADFLRDQRLRLLLRLAEEGPAIVEAAKAKKRALTFDDMLQRLYRALAGADRMPGLAERLADEYPAALIDEFQDTDPLQLAIFRAIYATGEADRGPLFLIGDPKQAIYSFRGADLHTYLSAKAPDRPEYRLPDNYRSTPAMIHAVNALFGVHEDAFRVAGLDFHPAGKGDKDIVPLVDEQAPDIPALAIWRLDDALAGAQGNKEAISRRCAEATVAEIARLLGGHVHRNKAGNREELKAGDIAILVRTHAQGRRMKQALADAGIGAVELSDASVLAAFEAEEMNTVLHAIAQAADTRLLRAALATVLLGRTSDEIAALNEDETQLGEWSERFAGYRSLWLGRGFAVMWQRFLTENGVIGRLLALGGGERRATNVLHLGELLGAREREWPGIEALLNGLAALQRDPSTANAAQLRLESDENLVRIVTKHRSKGLEYPVVFCPFLWDDGSPGKAGKSGLLLRYHDADGKTILDLAADDAGRAAARREQEEERLRLIYVALTRAIHRCYIVGGVQPSPRPTTHKAMLNWLVTGQGIAVADWSASGRNASVGPDQLTAAWQRFSEDHRPDVGFIEWPRAVASLGTSLRERDIDYRARIARRFLKPAWRRESYSSQMRLSGGDPEAADHDLHLRPTSAVARPAQIPDDDFLCFPRGPREGVCVHSVFERADFGRPARWPEAIASALARDLPPDSAAQGERYRNMLAEMLARVVASEIRPGLFLKDIERNRCLIETEFHYPLADLRPDRLLALLAAPRETGWPVSPGAFTGFLNGKIDLIFAHGERHYVLDWKSNHLGYTPEAYGETALKATVSEHGYDLQALIYLIALHRLLRHRLGHAYDYDRHFGGSLYLFVRGVRPDWPGAGVWHWRPERAQMDAVDRLFPQGGPGS